MRQSSAKFASQCSLPTRWCSSCWFASGLSSTKWPSTAVSAPCSMSYLSKARSWSETQSRSADSHKEDNRYYLYPVLKCLRYSFWHLALDFQADQSKLDNIRLNLRSCLTREWCYFAWCLLRWCQNHYLFRGSAIATGDWLFFSEEKLVRANLLRTCVHYIIQLYRYDSIFDFILKYPGHLQQTTVIIPSSHSEMSLPLYEHWSLTINLHHLHHFVFHSNLLVTRQDPHFQSKFDFILIYW